MKPFNLEICLKRSTIFYKRAFPKTVKICANINAGKATKLPPLGSLLGTYGVNAEAFCVQFNTLSAFYNNVLLPVIITILPSKMFIIKLKMPTFYSLFSMIFKKKDFKRNKRLEVPLQIALLIILYKIYLISQRTKKFFVQSRYTFISYDWQDLGEKPKVKYYKRKRK
jgi:ribosomal protein L11